MKFDVSYIGVTEVRDSDDKDILSVKQKSPNLKYKQGAMVI
jgi:hypothetical protein